MAVGTRMQQRRATAAVWTTSDYVLADGELGVTTDTGIIKIGNGVTPWTGLDPAFDSQYLPILGQAADSALLGGISAASFLKVVDATTAATADKVALRLNDGRLKATTGTASDDLTNKAQLDTVVTSVSDGKKKLIARTVTSAATLALTDAYGTVLVNHSSLTAQVVVTIPLNATVAFPVGSWMEVTAIGAGGAKISGAGGVTLSGASNAFPGYGTVRLVKTATDAWFGISMNAGKRLPTMKVIKNSAGTSYANGSYTFIPYNATDTSDTYNPDNEWFSIPGTGLATARRVNILKDGEYLVQVFFNSSSATVGFTQIGMMVADNTIAGGAYRCLIHGLGGTTNAILRTRFTAGQSVGASHNPAAASVTDLADGTSGIGNSMAITRLSD